jgi:hypothetical protein
MEEHLLEAAERGDAEAQFNLGVIYENGLNDSRYAAEGNRPEAIKSAFCENPLDHVDGNPVDPRDLGSRHPVLHPGADGRKLRAWDRGRYRLLGFDRRFASLGTDGRRRQCPQHTRFTCRLVDRQQRV